MKMSCDICRTEFPIDGPKCVCPKCGQEYSHSTLPSIQLTESQLHALRVHRFPEDYEFGGPTGLIVPGPIDPD